MMVKSFKTIEISNIFPLLDFPLTHIKFDFLPNRIQMGTGLIEKFPN